MTLSASTLAVCAHCGGLSGEDPQNPHLVQRCACRSDADQAPWPGFDFRRHSELCGLCAAKVIPTGSRWSSLLCPACAEVARLANDTAGFVLVPVGRHSLAHRIALPARSGAEPEQRGKFVNDLGGLRAGIDALTAWRARLVASRLPGQHDPVALDSYIKITVEEQADRGELLDEFIDFRRSTPRPT